MEVSVVLKFSIFDFKLIDSGEATRGKFCFQVGALFRCYLPIASFDATFAAKCSSNGGPEAVVSKWLAQGQNVWLLPLLFLFLFFLRQMRYFLSLTKPLSWDEELA